jgi:hypothetical protein
MKIAYLVMAHKNPQLLKSVVRTLSSEHSSFFIHIDRKSNIEPFCGIEGERVFFSEKRVPVYWGEFSQVEAILLLLRQAMEKPNSYSYFVLLSGSDYPLRSAKYIHRFLEESHGSDFMDLVKMPAPGKPLSRINTLRFPSNMPIRRFAVRALAKVGMAQRDYRKFLENMAPYSGGTWVLTRDTCQYILKFVERNPRVTAFFRDTFAPDEALFHTILGNSPFASRIRRGLYYTDWSANGAHPAMITEQHIASFEAQDKICHSDIYGSAEVLFARKFSDDRLDLVQRIDDMIKRKDINPGQP